MPLEAYATHLSELSMSNEVATASWVDRLVISHDYEAPVEQPKDEAPPAVEESVCYCCNRPVKDAQLQRHNNPGQPLSCGKTECPGQARKPHV